MTRRPVVDPRDELYVAAVRVHDFPRLSPAERFVILLVAVAQQRPTLSRAVFASIAGLSEYTIRRHLTNARRLGVIVPDPDRAIGYRIAPWTDHEDREATDAVARNPAH